MWDQGDIHFATLTTARYMERYINDRFLQFEFNLRTAEGLKIPNSSILKKDYYTLPADVITKGDEGNGVIKQVRTEEGKITKQFTIDILYQNKEYTIVSDMTSGGLSAFDHIVVEPSALSDDDFI